MGAAAQRLADDAERQGKLSLMMTLWRQEVEARRREHLFDSMAHQLEQQKRISAGCAKVLQRSMEHDLLGLMMSSWRNTFAASPAEQVTLSDEPQRRSCTSSLQLPVPPLLLSRSTPSLSVISSATPLDDCLRMPPGGDRSVSAQGVRPCSLEQDSDAVTPRTLSSRSATDTCAASTCGSRPQSPPGVRPQSPSRCGQRQARQPFAARETAGAEAINADAKKPLPKGPERFFYDTRSYTGCARFGGPTVVDKENLVMASRTRGTTWPLLTGHQDGVTTSATDAALPAASSANTPSAPPVQNLPPAGLAGEVTPTACAGPRRRLMTLR